MTEMRFVDNACEVPEDLSITDTLTNKRYEYGRVVDILNHLADENEQLKQQLNRLYNYVEDWYNDVNSANDFSEIWDNIKDNKMWD